MEATRSNLCRPGTVFKSNSHEAHSQLNSHHLKAGNCGKKNLSLAFFLPRLVLVPVVWRIRTGAATLSVKAGFRHSVAVALPKPHVRARKLGDRKA